MFKSVKKLFAGVLAAAIMLSGAEAAFAAGSPVTAPTAVTEEKVKEDNSGDIYATWDYGHASLVTKEKTSKKSVTVPATVVVKGYTYDVTVVRNDAFKNAKKMTKVVLSKNTSIIRKKAFRTNKKLKTIVAKTTKKMSIAKTAFKGIDTKKITFKANKKMSKKNKAALKKALKKAGFKGKLKFV